MADFSFSPQFATIRSESPLAGMRPVTPTFTALSFAEQRPLEIKSAKPELVSQAIASGLQEGVGSALKGITAAYVGERDKKAKLEEEARKFERDKELARIKSEKTEEEKLYDTLRRQNIESLIESRGGKKTPKNIVPSGTFSQPKPEQEPTSGNIIEVPLPTQEDDNLPIDFDTPLFGEASSTSLQNMTPVAPRKTYAGFALTPEGRQIQAQAKEYDLPEMQTLLASDASYGVSDVGGKDVLSQQTQASAMTPKGVPTTPEAIADFATQAEEIRRKQIDEMIQANPPVETMPTQQQLPVSAEPEFDASQFIGATFEDWRDAEKVNQMLAKQFPDHVIKPVQQVDIEGSTYFKLQQPEKKDVTGIPEGLKVKSAKMSDGELTYDLEPEASPKQQIAAIKKPLESTDTMLRTIGQIRRIYEGWSPATGGFGSIFQYIPASDAADVRKLIKTLQGNIAFKTLNDMRAASKTGAALGSISEKELDLLASSMGSIDPNLSHFLFKENLDEIERILNTYKQAANTAIQEIEKPQKFTPLQPKQQSTPKENATATNPRTGEKIIFKNGQWIPAQ